MTDPGRRLDAVERVTLANLPTPLEDTPRLAEHAGLAWLAVKRDDETGLAFGGNKARKLEYDLAEPMRTGCEVLLTVGGTQSNHAVMTAAAARRLGLDVKLVLGGPDFGRFEGNLLLDVLYGAEIRYLIDRDDDDALAAEMDEWAQELRRAGRRPFALPLGGSSGAGALGYVRAVRELAGQAAVRWGAGPLQIVTAVGSCGTFAGLSLGARLFLPEARVVGISVSRTAAGIRERTAGLVRDAAAILGVDVPLAPGDFECYDEYRGAYGVPTPAGQEAIRAAARLEGLVLDPVYTGKAMSGLVELSRRRVLDPGIPTVFLHTGGRPIVFAFEEELGRGATVTKRVGSVP